MLFGDLFLITNFFLIKIQATIHISNCVVVVVGFFCIVYCLSSGCMPPGVILLQFTETETKRDI